MEKKKQHYIPQSYLKAWCDSTAPKEQTPYVWIFPTAGGAPKKKAPENIFYEKELYTVKAEDGSRDLTIENNLSRLEGEFATLRREKFGRRISSLSQRERLMLCMFTMAMFGRTKKQASHISSQWAKALELGEHMQRTIEGMTTEERLRASAILSGPDQERGEGITLDEVRAIVENPLQHTLSETVVEVTPLLYKIPFIMLEARWPDRFITSDSPCVWFDAQGSGGLNSPTIEITLPISPTHLILFGHQVRGKNGFYVQVDKAVVDHFNRRTRRYADDYFVSNKPSGW